MNLSVLSGAFLRDLLAQPQALTDTLAALASATPVPQAAVRAGRVVLTGMGSSLHALYPLQLRLIGEGRSVHLVETAELIHAQRALLTGDTLVVIVSQSGRSAETVQLLDLIASQPNPPFVLGVTNTADSPLARRADRALLMRAGDEFSVSCKTYVATLVTLEWLGAALCAEDLAPVLQELADAPAAVEDYLSHWQSHVAEIASSLAGVRHLFITGRGSSLAAVGTGALITKESTRFHAEGMSSPAFRHGPLEMAGPGLFALVFTGDATAAPLNATLVNDLRATGATAQLVREQDPAQRHENGGVFVLPSLGPRLRPILEILPVQMLCLALAALQGREPGRFERATKVTTIA